MKEEELRTAEKSPKKGESVLLHRSQNLVSSVINITPRVNRRRGRRQLLPVEIISLHTEEPQNRPREPSVRRALMPSFAPAPVSSTPGRAAFSVSLTVSILSKRWITRERGSRRRERQMLFEEVVPDVIQVSLNGAKNPYHRLPRM